MENLIEDFANKQLRLIELERNSEIESYNEVFHSNSCKELERMGYGLFNLVISEHCIGMFGRHIVTLAKIHHGPLGNPALKSGDVVKFSSENQLKSTYQSDENKNNNTNNYEFTSATSAGVNATITKISANLLTITCDTLPTAVMNSYSTNFSSIKDLCVTKTPSDVTYKRLSKVGKRLANGILKGGVNVASWPLLSQLFKPAEEENSANCGSETEGKSNITGLQIGDSESICSFDSKDVSLGWFNSDLNASQQKCVDFCLKQKHLAVIHGPPGTGKTTTVVEFILQEIKRGNRVLACAPSNVAVDNLVSQLFKFKKESAIKMIRLGHPARASETSKMFTVDSKILESDFSDVIRDLRQEIFKAKQEVSSGHSKGDSNLAFREASKKLPGLKKDLRKIEEKCIKELLESSNVVLSTCSSAHEDGTFRLLEKKERELLFDVCVIDECGQSIESESWIPLLNASKLVIAGDHMQLPPTVMSQEAEKCGLSVSLLERIVHNHPTLVKLLDIQYRMNDIIMNWASKAFYDEKLKFGNEEVENRSLENYLNISDREKLGENEFLLSCGMMLIDTNDCEMFELESTHEESKGNEAEADLVAYHVKTLIRLGIPQREIAVISPYNLQIELIRSRISHLYANIEIRSVDGFQGREKEAIVLSLVRSNPNFEIGFLSESRRLNVAITRAKRHVCVICDSKTVSIDNTLKGLVQYIETNGVAFTAGDYLDKEDMEWSFVKPEKLQKLPKLKVSENSSNKSTKPKSILRTDKNGDVYFDKKALLSEIEQFASKKQRTEMKFPKSLPAAARAFVHEEAEKMGLKHESVGSGSNRRIVLSKMSIVEQNHTESLQEKEIGNFAAEEIKSYSGTSENVNESNLIDGSNKPNDTLNQNEIQTSSVEKESENSHQNKLSDDNEVNGLKSGWICSLENEIDDLESTERLEESTFPSSSMMSVDQSVTLCSMCFKNIPKPNFDTHVLHCAKVQKSKQEKSQPNKKSTGKKTFKEKTKSKIDALEDDDFDELCDAFQQLNSVCNETKCKTSIVNLSFVCNYCEAKFCSQHRCPENHGCDREDVKRKARKNMRDPPPPVRTSQQQNSARLHGKMKDKIENMRKDRNSNRGSHN